MRKNVFLITSLFIVGLLMIKTTTVNAQKAAMEPETLWEFERVGGTKVSPDGRSLLFTVTRFEAGANKSFRDIYTLPVAGGDPKNITSSEVNESNAVWRPDGKKIGFISNESGSNQIWEMDPDGSNRKQLSDIEGGVTAFDYSPDLKNIWYTKSVKIDVSPADMHPDLPQANALIYDDLMYRHWDSWHDYTYSHVFIAALNSNGTLGSAKDIMEGEAFDSPLKPFGGASQIAFTPDGKSLAYTSKKLSGKEKAVSTNSDIYLYSLESGQTRNLTQFNPGYDKNPVFSPDGRYMAWESMRTAGFEADKNRIMIMDLRDGSYRDYSDGFDQASESLRWSKDSKSLYFISGHHATYQVYQMELSKNKITPITQGHHNYSSLATAGDFLIGERMSMSAPTEIYRISPRNGQQVRLTSLTQPVLDKIEMGKVEERWIETTDGEQMLVWVIFPPDFDETEKYPALLFCGGGPQNAISQSFSYRWNFQLMAAKGYIVIAPNRRGVPTFGQEWNDQISQDYGGLNMQDLLTAARTISQEPYVDETNLGAVGASYGGYSVFWLAGHHQGLFSTFIAHCGMFNFESWYGTTEEMFFANHDLGGPYWTSDRPKSYDFSPHLFLSNWDTPMMVIHGAKDYRVPISEGMQAFNAARMMNIPSRLLVFPDENHWVLKPQNSLLWQREFFKWLDQWLKDDNDGNS